MHSPILSLPSRNMKVNAIKGVELAPPGRARAEGEEMRAERLQQLEQMAEELLATASKLPPGQDRHNAFQEIGRFRARITGLRRSDLRSAHRKLKAKGK